MLLPVALFAQVDFNFQSQFKYLKGSEASLLPYNWMFPAFDDSPWSTGNAPFWYGDGSGGTVFTDMQHNYPTVYLRTSFTAENSDLLETAMLMINYDDGFVIWINGQQVLWQNAPPSLTRSAFATQNH